MRQTGTAIAAAALLAAVAAYVGVHRSTPEDHIGGDAAEARSVERSINPRPLDSPQLNASQQPTKSGDRADAHSRRVEANNRATCIANIRNVQQAMRSYQNMKGISPGEAGYQNADLIGPKSFLESRPICPSGGTYDWADGKFPPVGKLALKCSHAGHVPHDHEDW